MSLIYLSGPIANCTEHEKTWWRDLVKEWGFPTIDPVKWNLPEKWDGLAAACIVASDKVAILKCNIMLVYPWKNSFGTSMEILYAWEQGKRVIVVWDRSDYISPWIVAHSDRRVVTWEEAKQAITDYTK